MNTLKRLIRRMTESIQRERLVSLFQRKCALYKRFIFRAERVYFRRFITEELDINRFGGVCDMVIGKWKEIVPYRLITSSGEEVSIWIDVQAKFPKRHPRLEYTPETPMPNKAAGFDGLCLIQSAAKFFEHLR